MGQHSLWGRGCGVWFAQPPAEAGGYERTVVVAQVLDEQIRFCSYIIHTQVRRHTHLSLNWL